MLEIRRYCDSDRAEWDGFVRKAKNSLFMFERGFMDYHRDRFEDHSLLFYYNNELIALLPMNERENCLYSHGGLTYGGMITDCNMKQHIMNDCFQTLIEYARDKRIEKIIYKFIPHIYHSQAAEEDKYSVFACGGRIVSVDVSTFVNLKFPLKMSKGRRAQISRAKREGVLIKEMSDAVAFEKFINLENKVLERHGVTAVHSAEELKLLKDRFPDNIHLIVAELNGDIISGTVIFEYDKVIHTQYMASNEIGRCIGGLDFVVSSLFERYSETKDWIDFGISTEHGRLYLNEGLTAQKESFGGRTGVYEICEIDI